MSDQTIKEYHHDDNCFWGYAGAFLGNALLVFLGVMLWNYTNREGLFAYLSILSPIFGFEGYKFFKGIVNHNTIGIVIVISLITYYLSVFFILPNYILKEARSCSFSR